MRIQCRTPATPLTQCMQPQIFATRSARDSRMADIPTQRPRLRRRPYWRMSQEGAWRTTTRQSRLVDWGLDVCIPHLPRPRNLDIMRLPMSGDTLMGSVSAFAEAGCRDCDRLWVVRVIVRDMVFFLRSPFSKRPSPPPPPPPVFAGLESVHLRTIQRPANRSRRWIDSHINGPNDKQKEKSQRCGMREGLSSGY